MHPEFVSIAGAIDALRTDCRSLNDKMKDGADINYLSLDDLMRCINKTDEAFKIVTMSRKIETNGKLD